MYFVVKSQFQNALLYKNEGCYRPENLQKEMFLECLITKESLKLRGPVILHFRTLMTSHENKEYLDFWGLPLIFVLWTALHTANILVAMASEK